VEIVKAKKAIKDAKAKAKATYSGMFSKISMYDDKEAPAIVPVSSPDNKKVQTAAYLSVCLEIMNVF
jgi:hypothetical protein